ncbi:hypothetical protein HDC36_003382 [Xanthomonas sp. JAI131]|uniref:hypothetical protein n=1 Tax=Xanthomonas sp. JAI131 TaxID=2723067 RepID=UPI0015C8A338|nr:hypothetical protein [Xanthomonas sp. JAI131]NYF21906.1 hypothetical protein [Xanthomonas sp. JAI131]
MDVVTGYIVGIFSGAFLVIGVMVFITIVGMAFQALGRVEKKLDDLQNQLGRLQDQVSLLPDEECEHSRQIRKQRRELISMGIDPR